MGLLGVSRMATDITFGEAGTEAAAILRNPRKGTWKDLMGQAPSNAPMGDMTIEVPLMLGEKELARAVIKYVARDGAWKTTTKTNR
jgi:hypothetical protein